jgi:hypothetical protein
MSNKKGFITSKKQQYRDTTTKYKLKKPTIQRKANRVTAESTSVGGVEACCTGVARKGPAVDGWRQIQQGED